MQMSEKIAQSNIRILGSKSSPNMRGVGSVINCSKDAGNVRKKFQTFLKILIELKTTPVNNWRTPTYAGRSFGA